MSTPTHEPLHEEPESGGSERFSIVAPRGRRSVPLLGFVIVALLLLCATGGMTAAMVAAASRADDLAVALDDQQASAAAAAEEAEHLLRRAEAEASSADARAVAAESQRRVAEQAAAEAQAAAAAAAAAAEAQAAAAEPDEGPTPSTGETNFLSRLRSSNAVFTTVPDGTLIAIATNACAYMATMDGSEADFGALTDMGTSAGFSSYDTGSLLSAATATMCPEFQHLGG